MVLTIGKIEGGTRNNILAGKVRMEGTLRTLNEQVREQVRTLMRQVGRGVAEANGAAFELEWLDENPVTYNDPALTAKSLPSLARVFGKDNLIRTDPQMGGEDFAYFQKVIPGFFYFLGVGNPAKGFTAIQHTPMFDMDEDALAMGVKAEATLLLDYLDQLVGAYPITVQ
jgi:amidohydrolase